MRLNMENLTPRCYKKNLLLIAGIVWILAGGMVLKLGLDVFLSLRSKVIISIIVSIVIFYIFFNFIFKKLVNKHRDRIADKDKEKLCIFSFFDTKSYIIMAVMMTLGITIRESSFVKPIYWSPVYIGIGSALFLAGILFIVQWKRWK
ncbi:hypothetical protein [Romboutsia hominis]|nr:hypothetical protein [Romboutsia hominis]